MNLVEFASIGLEGGTCVAETDSRKKRLSFSSVVPSPSTQ
jgi:hypothetical protein